MMDSSFLTWVNVGLGLYSGISFLKLLILFGLPNHPARFTAYLVSLCATAYFVMKAMTGLGHIPPVYFMKWRSLPLVAGSLALLLQIIAIIGSFSVIQQKVISRLPLIAALLVYAFFSAYADWFFASCLVIGAIFFSISVGKARYQKRMYFKMLFFLGLFALFSCFNQYWLYVIGEIFVYFALFYFFIFEQTFGVSALVEGYQHSREGASA